MQLGAPSESFLVAATAVFVGFVCVGTGIRVIHSGTASALSRFLIASVALVIAALTILRVISPVVAYGALCLALVSVFLFDLLRAEHARRRRVASLAPRPAAEVVPTVWVAIAVASVLMLAPYVIFDQQRAAAFMVGICALVMAGIAWRIASAPVQLKGLDIQSERMRDRASRFKRAGLSTVVAVGSIMVFIGFVGFDSPAELPWQRILHVVAFVTWTGLLAWVMLYWRRLERLSHSMS
jgi:hypothetical protein